MWDIYIQAAPSLAKVLTPLGKSPADPLLLLGEETTSFSFNNHKHRLEGKVYLKSWGTVRLEYRIGGPIFRLTSSRLVTKSAMPTCQGLGIYT